MVMIVGIFERPEDHPDSYVARRWYVNKDGQQFRENSCELFETRELAQQWVSRMHPETERMEPDDDDVPYLVDTYVGIYSGPAV